jgi:peptide chain release factor 3
MKPKQLQKGIDQLMDEGVAQLFVNQFNNRKIIGTVGQLQFEVIQYRLEKEYNAKCRSSQYDSADAAFLCTTTGK